jgi:tol-pal system protein YbgF
MFSGCATPQDVQILDERLYRLEQQNEQLAGVRQTREENEEKLRNQSAEIRALIRQVYGEVQKLRGRLEETDYLLRQSMQSGELRRTEVDATLGHLEDSLKLAVHRIDRLEEFLDLKNKPEPEGTASVAEPAAPVPEGTKSALPEVPETSAPQAMYDAAKALFDKGEFSKARDQFQVFLSRYTDSDNADNAQFWIGETHYREGWYEKAILEYQKVIDNYPKGNKVRACLLKQGFAFYNIGDKDNARLILKELVAKYPKSPEAQLATEKLKVF